MYRGHVKDMLETFKCWTVNPKWNPHGNIIDDLQGDSNAQDICNMEGDL